MAAPKDVRRELSRLILDGLMGRTLKQLYQQMRDAFLLAGESVSLSAFDSWVGGLKFPANRHRQLLIAQVVGGACGEAISKLPGPAFRGYRRRVMKEDEGMGHGMKHGQHRGRWVAREFPTTAEKGEDGVLRYVPTIICAGCGARDYQRGRKGKMDDADLFRVRGWEVGESAAHDFCPSCVKARKVVVKMEDHVKKYEATANGTASKTEEDERKDARILSRLIEDHWDEGGARYLPGYSDMRLAQEVSRPVEWVKAIRERDFGGVGEDPQLTDFLAATISITEELAGLHGHMEGLAASVSELTSQHDKVQRLLEKYRDGHNALAAKTKRLSEVADHMRPFDKRASA